VLALDATLETALEEALDGPVGLELRLVGRLLLLEEIGDEEAVSLA
jgi:hypothetical protein